MRSPRLTRILLILLVLVLSIGLDQGTKAIIRKHYEYYDSTSYLNHHFHFTRVENGGAFLSLGDSLSGPMRSILLNFLPLAAIVFGLYYVVKKTDLDNFTVVAISLIIAGGLGNVYDRLLHGSVTDFMQMDFILFKTGIFNVADMSIMAGTFMILLHAWLKKKPEDVEVKKDISPDNQV